MEQIIYNETKIPKIIESLFYFSWFFLALSLFYKHTKTFLWISYILITFLSIYLLIKNFSPLKEKVALPLIILSLWLLILFWFVVISPYKIASLEAFLLNYFFHVFLFLFLFFYISLNNYIQRNIFWIILGLVGISVIFYYCGYVLIQCNYIFSCFIKSSIIFVDSSFLKGLISVTSPLIFLFLIFLALGIESEKYKKIFIFISFFYAFFLVYLGRRIFLVSLIVIMIISNSILTKKNIQKYIIYGSSFIILIALIFLLTPFGKEVMISFHQDKLNLLLSTKKEDWAQAGSMGMRLYIWPIYLKKSLEEPFSGTGLGRRVQKRVLAETNRKALSLEHAHNLFLNMALQAGWQSALLFLIFYLLTLKRAYQLVKISGERPLYLGLLMFLIAFLIMSLFEGMEEGTRFTPFWVASGMVWGYYVREREKGCLSA